MKACEGLLLLDFAATATIQMTLCITSTSTCIQKDMVQYVHTGEFSGFGQVLMEML